MPNIKREKTQGVSKQLITLHYSKLCTFYTISAGMPTPFARKKSLLFFNKIRRARPGSFTTFPHYLVVYHQANYNILRLPIFGQL